MNLIPNRFLFRIAYPCRYIAQVPLDGDDLLDLPDFCRIDNYTDMDGRRDFADVRLAWNDEGIAVQVEVRGKEREPVGDALNRATPTAFLSGSTRATPASVIALAVIATSFTSCR